MNTTHHYNLDLDNIADKDAFIAVQPNTLDVFASLAQEFSSLNEGWSKTIQDSMAVNISEITKLAIPSESLLKTLQSVMEPTKNLRNHWFETFKRLSTGSALRVDHLDVDVSKLTRNHAYEEFPSIVDDDFDIAEETYQADIGKTLIKLPKNPEWKHLELILTSDRDLIIYYRGKKVGVFNCEELGMARMSTSDKKPDKKFILLYHISLILQNKHLGVQPTADILAAKQKDAKVPTEKQLSLLYQTKSLLSKQLKNTFGIDNEPFHDYDVKHGYQPKFTLKFSDELQVGLHEELPDPNSEKTPEYLRAHQEPIE